MRRPNSVTLMQINRKCGWACVNYHLSALKPLRSFDPTQGGPTSGFSLSLFPQVCAYVDLHGHSRKHNVFMYGCHSNRADHSQLLHERVLPFLFSQQVCSLTSSEQSDSCFSYNYIVYLYNYYYKLGCLPLKFYINPHKIIGTFTNIVYLPAKNLTSGFFFYHFMEVYIYEQSHL